MYFAQVLNKFIRLFYFCGLSCYPPFDGFLTIQTKRNRLVHYIPTAALIFLNVVLSIPLIVCCFLADPLDDISVINMAHLFPIAQILTLLPCAIQMVYLWPNFGTIYSHISIIDRLLWEKFSDVSSNFGRYFLRRIFVIFACFLVELASSEYERQITLLTITITASLIMLKIVILLIVVHACFYIDLLGQMLECFALHIESRVDIQLTPITPATTATNRCRSPLAYQLMAELLHFKVVHFRLWRISEKINHLFGWTICITFLQFFILSGYNVYTAHEALLRDRLDIFRILREF